jgi:hypothetical protein
MGNTRKQTDADPEDFPQGAVSEDDIEANDRERRPTGQDHSTENYGATMPDHGVGGVQNANDTTSDIARIED